MLRNLCEAVLDLIFPPRRVCPLCGVHSPEAQVCSGCLELLAGYAAETVCPLCGSYFAGRSGPVGYATGRVLCSDCREGRPFTLARAVGPYEGSLRQAVHRLKYRGAGWQARPMARLMAQTWHNEPAFARSQSLVPVPLHPARERRRGFNQAVLLARALGDITGVPVLERAAARVRETPPQTGLPRHERLRNLSGAFQVTAPNPVSGKIITIVDDVFTTGSTVTKLSQLFRQAGAAEILVLTFAIVRQKAKN